MKELIPKDEYGIFADTHDIARVDSLYVAEFFEKNHKEVLRDIRKITDTESGLSADFRQRNFAPSSYTNSQNKKQPCYCLTRDGFTMLAMGYTGKKAMEFKELYIRRFNEMEKFIKTLASARQEFPLLTANIKLLHDSPKPYHYSNECNLLYRIVLGMSAKQYRIANNLEKGIVIRPFLNQEKIDMLEILQKVDVGLLVAFPNYEDRKRHLEWYKNRLEEDK
ncbi:Rha family transcriptional regulator [Eubacteriaceae bacterium ES2]|nr:Rha family transcriptional regulator [Eubacteriaceae bacterium ES2]